MLEAGKNVATQILQEIGATDIRATRYDFAAHQIGTVAMGTDPGASVVDANLRAHDLENLYLVGSGTFPTATCSRRAPTSHRSSNWLSPSLVVT